MMMADSNFNSCSSIGGCSDEIDFILNIKSPVLKLAETQMRNLMNDADFIVPECAGWSCHKEAIRHYFPIFGMSILGFITTVVLCLQASNMACSSDTNHMQSIPRIINIIDMLLNSEKSDNYHGVY